MKNLALVIVPALLLVIGMGGYLASQGPGDNPDIRVIESTKLTPDPSVDNGIDLATSGGEYAVYDTASTVANQLGEDTTLLFFHARWCPTCLSLDRNLEAGTIPDDVKILKLDYDDEDDLKDQYGVTFQHTIVQVDAEGAFVNSFFGSRDIEEIVEQVL